MKELRNNPAFLYGESVFTTCLVKNGVIDLWKEHFEQLLNNAMRYYLLEELDRPYLRQLVLDALGDSQYNSGALRISISSKNREKLFTNVSIQDLEVTISFRVISKRDGPLKLKTFTRSQDTLLDELKIGSYGKEFYLKRLALNEGFDDILFCDEKNIYEGSTSNIFFIKDEKLITPSCGIYKGIMREKIIIENEVEVRNIFVSELDSFDGAFFTNSISIISPVGSINNVQFPLLGDYPIKCVPGFALKG